MKLVIGLGNPGPEYTNTRHNVGRFLVSQMQEITGFKLIQSSVFMNRSGQFVADLLKRTGVDPRDLIVVHDDWAFEVGEFRTQKDHSANRHKGVESIIDALGSQDFWRVRVGIGKVPAGVEANDYVLGELRIDEKKTIADLVQPIVKMLQSKVLT